MTAEAEIGALEIERMTYRLFALLGVQKDVEDITTTATQGEIEFRWNDWPLRIKIESAA